METKVKAFEIEILMNHSLQDLACKIDFNPSKCIFSKRYDHPSTGSFVLYPLPREWNSQNEDALDWAPLGLRPVGLSALINLGVEHPEIQEKLVVIATGAYDCAPGGIYRPYLSAAGQHRFISVPNFGVSWIGKKDENLYGLFCKP